MRNVDWARWPHSLLSSALHYATMASSARAHVPGDIAAGLPALAERRLAWAISDAAYAERLFAAWEHDREHAP